MGFRDLGFRVLGFRVLGLFRYKGFRVYGVCSRGFGTGGRPFGPFLKNGFRV